MKSVEGRKEEKVKEIKRKGHLAIWGRVKECKSQSVRTGAVLKNCMSESKQKREKNRESKRKYTVRKRAISEKKKRVLFFT